MSTRQKIYSGQKNLLITFVLFSSVAILILTNYFLPQIQSFFSRAYVTNISCPQVYSPVCAKNGLTYTNSCDAKQYNVQVACQGTCPCKETCSKQYSPVCGSDGKTYINSCSAKQSNVVAECSGACPCKTVAYFRMADYVDTSNKFPFTIKVTEPAKIDHIRKILAGEDIPNSGIQGKVALYQAPYNKNWGFFLEPLSISFFQIQIELCDSSIQGIQSHLREIGGAYLPGNRWCPWETHLVDEISAPKQTK